MPIESTNPKQQINTLQRNSVASSPMLSVPGFLWYGMFLVVPLLIVVATSFLKRGPYGGILPEPTLDNHLRAWDPLYAEILWNSVKLSAGATGLCFLAGLPMAYVIARSRASLRTFLVLCMMLPFFANFIIRAYAIRSFLGVQGPIYGLLMALGYDEWANQVGAGSFAVWYGMVTNYLPFMTLPLYVVLEKFDFKLLDAGKDLGAGRLRLLFGILLPVIWPGVAAGLLLVFIPALGEFLIPDFLGGARTMLIGNLVTDQFLKTRDWPFGAALVVQILALVGLALVFRRLSAKRQGGVG